MPAFGEAPAYLYSNSGGNKSLVSAAEYRKGAYTFTVKNAYTGLLNFVLPDKHIDLALLADNKNISAELIPAKDNKFTAEYYDAVNKQYHLYNEYEFKSSKILPLLQSLKTVYPDHSDFSAALTKEISQITTQKKPDLQSAFTKYYVDTQEAYLQDGSGKTPKDYIDLFNNSGMYLENSGLIKNLLIAYLQTDNDKPTEEKIDTLLTAVGKETPRGQLLLSELIAVFDAYGMQDLKTKYIGQAESMTCSITGPLAETLKANKNTAVGAVFPDYTFVGKDASAKSLYQIKADKKIVFFWSSTCSHCEKQLPDMINAYTSLKKNGIEIIGIALDTEKAAFNAKKAQLPWYNDSELKGWYAESAKNYGVHGTPTFFILDKNNKIIAKPNSFREAKDFLKIN